ncbi:MAG: hypothetical protein AVDCRST_MAG88-4557, partial [uncultured Thermomicrobiales bacterium]
QTIGGGKGGQTISFPAPGDKPFGDAPFAVGATASSGLPVSFAAAGACTVAGDVVTLTSGGSCTLTAAQGGNANYNPAAGVSHTFNVTYRLTLSATAGGSAGASPVGPNYLAGTVATVTATPAAGHIFTGWTIGGAPTGDRCIGWANPFTITMNANYTVVASFVPLPAFPDVSASNPAHDAISQLAARKVILGYQDGRFGPQDNTLRAQMAALIARAMCWDNESHRNAFPDQGSVDPKLWNNVGTLAHYNVARGYPDGTYKPTANVLYAQTISFITRAMVAKGYWIQQPDNRLLYPNVPAGSGHREDIVTYVHYTGAIPGTNPAANWDNWARPSTRAEFAVALWQALNSYWGVDRVP